MIANYSLNATTNLTYQVQHNALLQLKQENQKRNKLNRAIKHTN